MKKISRYCLALCLSFAFGTHALQASTTLPAPALTTTQTTTDPRAQELTQRLEQIQAMDKSHLTAKEKKALRKEVREIKRASGGIYLSAGAVILIVVLIILLV